MIIPTYKRSDNLVRAIDSVLSQTYRNLEVIVVDDNDENSKYRDENKKRLERYIKDGSIIYLKHKKNRNGAAARNTGLRRCTGDYVTFLDDDDVFVNTRVERLVDLLEANPSSSFAYSSVAISEYGRVINVIRANKSGDLQYDVLCQRSFFGTGSNMFFRRGAIDRVGLFDEKFVRHQDMEYMVRFFRTGEAIPVDEVLVVKYIDDISNIPSYSVLKQMKEMYLSKFKGDIDKYNADERDMIYYCNYYELLVLFPHESNKLVKELNKYGRVGLLSYLKIYIKMFYNKCSLIKKLVAYMKSIKYVGVLRGLSNEN
ncbi:glycosyltransferase family 2 protein [Candidatus Saccharibacteria bacterium]|nr:glycosyltransferase family 2 protein [Candidatus Saccharibacteria bacterium]